MAKKISNVADFFDQRIIFHTHIAKAAGSTLLRAFTDMFGSRVYDLRDKTPPNTSALTPTLRRQIWVLSGHFWYGGQDRFFERQPVYLASVRHPVDRFVSFYRFVMSSDPPHPALRRMEGKSFGQVVRDFIEASHPLINNEMSRSLGVMDDLKALENTYAIVAPNNRINELAAALARCFDREIALARRENIGIGPDVSMDEETSRMLLRFNQKDMALWDYVNCRFDGWLGNLESRLCR